MCPEYKVSLINKIQMNVHLDSVVKRSIIKDKETILLSIKK